MKLIFQSIILAGAAFLILFASMLVIGYLQTFSSTPAPITDDVITLQNEVAFGYVASTQTRLVLFAGVTAICALIINYVQKRSKSK